jgi:hypothetical protein
MIGPNFNHIVDPYIADQYNKNFIMEKIQMSEQSESTKSSSGRISNSLNIILIMVIAAGMWQFHTLKKNYDANMTTVLAKINTMEQDIITYTESVKKSMPSPTKDLDDLKNYITTKFPKVPCKDVDIIAAEVNFQCIENNIPVAVVVGLIEIESSFRKSAKSKRGARGLMQIQYNVWGKELCIPKRVQLYDIGTNIDAGVCILKHYIDKNNGDITKALQNYSGSHPNGTKFSNKVFRAIGQYSLFCSLYKNDSVNYLAKGKEKCTTNVPGTRVG